MKKLMLLLALVFCFGLFALAQNQPSQTPQSGGDTAAAPAGQTSDQSTMKADTGTKMKGSKSIKGCLSGPDASGNYTLAHGKKTVTVAANDELKNHVGHEVKLTGTESGGTFTATKIDHISDTCTMGGKHKKSDDTMGGTNPK